MVGENNPSRGTLFHLIQSRIDYQTNLINQRLSIMLTIQAFLFAAWVVIVVETTPASLENFAPEIGWLYRVILLLGYFTSTLTCILVQRALDATEELKRLYIERANSLPPDRFLPPIGFEAPEGKIKWIMRFWRNSPFLFALLFLIAWILLTSAGPKPSSFWKRPLTVKQQNVPSSGLLLEVMLPASVSVPR